MELNKHICTQMMEKTNAFAQITLDDDFIVRDNKPDVERVIYSKADVRIEDAKSGNQVVWITGRLCFSTLYQSDDENRRLDCVSGEIPFQEKVVMDALEDGDEVNIDVKIEDLTVGIINSRKLMICAVLNISAECSQETQAAFSCRIKDADCQQKTQEYTMLCLSDIRRDIIHMQKEMLLPNARTNIGELVFYQVDFRNEEVTLSDDRICVQMDAQLWVLYRSESTGEYECFETTVPVSGFISCRDFVGDEIFWAKVRPVETELEPRADYDGESRMLGLDLEFMVEVQIYREENCELLCDAYALDQELELECEQELFSQLLVKNISKIRLMEQEQLEPNQPRILQICGSSGEITIDRVQKREDGVHVEGILNVHILYHTIDDRVPFAHAKSQIPFEQFMEIEGFSEDVHICMEQKIEQLQVNLLDNMEYEVKAIVQIGMFVQKTERISNIVAIEERPLDVELLQKQPGMIGCIRKPEEDLWDIAKKYHATSDNIIEIGNRVLVVKQMK